MVDVDARTAKRYRVRRGKDVFGTKVALNRDRPSGDPHAYMYILFAINRRKPARGWQNRVERRGRVRIIVAIV